MVGAVIGNYQLVRMLGQGGMGAVYLGHHTLLGQSAAVKVLLPQLSARPDIINRFFHEAHAVTSISDPGIVQVFDFGYHSDGNAFIVMEYLDGEPLDRRLSRVGRLAMNKALRLGCQLATSLAAAHAQHVIHRDLKPETIYLVHDTEVASGERTKILDFGIAKLTDDKPGKKRTVSGVLIGTPAYMSPEQCLGLAHVDHRADIYALGCVLYHALVGRPPFDGEGPGDIISAHIREPAVAPSAEAPEIPPHVDTVVLRCLAKAPGDRFQTMAELATAIRQALQQDGMSDAAMGMLQLTLTPTATATVTATVQQEVAPTLPTTPGASSGQLAAVAPAPGAHRHGWWPLAAFVLTAVGIAIVSATVDPEVPDGAQATKVAMSAEASTPARGGPIVTPIIVEEAGVAAVQPPIASPDAAEARPVDSAATSPVATGSAPPAEEPSREPPKRGGDGNRAPATAKKPRVTLAEPRTPALPPRAAVVSPRTAPVDPRAAGDPRTAVGPRAVEPGTAVGPRAVEPGTAVGPRAVEPGTAVGPRAVEPGTAVEPRVGGEPRPVAPRAPEAATKSRDATEATTATRGATPPASDSGGVSPSAQLPSRAPATSAPPIGSLDAKPSIQDLDVTGSLTRVVVQRGLEPLLPSLRTCYRNAARERRTTPAIDLPLRFEIDENGVALRVTTTGESFGSLGNCTASTIKRFRMPQASEAGAATVSAVIRFRPS